jgi:predicted ribosomally synthesized peptide with nif11-like leader
MSRESFERFRALVIEDPDLQARLSGFEDLQKFEDAVLEAAAEREFDFSRQELQQALREARRSWIERWLA